MKYERSDLNALPSHLVNSALIHKCAMRHSSGPTISLGIKTFDQQDLIRLLLLEIVPAMVLVRSNGIRLPHPIRIYQLDRYQITIGYGSCIDHGERVFPNCLDGPPEVDDLESSSEKLVRLLWQMMCDSVRCGFIRLVDVDSLYRTAEGWSGFAGIIFIQASVLGFTTNGVIEDEDLGGTGALRLSGYIHVQQRILRTTRTAAQKKENALTLPSKPTPPPDNKLA